jgi:hypothetical protein
MAGAYRSSPAQVNTVSSAWTSTARITRTWWASTVNRSRELIVHQSEDPRGKGDHPCPLGVETVPYGGQPTPNIFMPVRPSSRLRERRLAAQLLRVSMPLVIAPWLIGGAVGRMFMHH